ncbi:hypothetical protein AV530_015735 [Patagioenas fasciata monilis]|uniref:Uncharacterized protein n=1 Tax=Patagioenas fasciata monilis TaxID=372326 RepID=A0A1V4KKD8_PATFA|nr:hypothetical protein AV530_015735 [Patagioenas fasciata monilis]
MCVQGKLGPFKRCVLGSSESYQEGNVEANLQGEMKKAVCELDAEVHVLSLPGSLSPWKLLQQSPCSQESCLLGRSCELIVFIGGGPAMASLVSSVQDESLAAV